MTFLNSNQYLNNQYFGSSSSAEMFPPLTPIPLTLALFLTDSLFPQNSYSPAGALLIPLKILNIPLSYLTVIALGLATSLLAKWSSAFSGIPALSQYQQAYPDIRLFLNGLPLSPQSNDAGAGGNDTGNQQEPETPLEPKGLAFNLALITPYSGVPQSTGTKFVLIYGIEIFEIKKLPKTIIPLLILFIYFLFYPKYKNDPGNTE
ncbi:MULTISPECIES: hypothetical protein [unclassified Dehalobacter]|jgi:hypothetical protein|uniref:hypothetical protein n=1 Tax=unclassified Dehalobacter TaxID=2635733 RepID=UPI00028BAA96|nr:MULTISPECIES: hypothetical protein [unclassified Dehalobacter]AFV03676.1 hypothetical protein DHBDCA_p2649 [Dehalobacter sp. DCA]AFV06663.1 hypothetical protein DCF50_p2660 [Dehalobacter sp. CF]EQB20358.1 hypothetical protein UNSWDHB_2418 [Dehalobacter sp. UNSWDHB]MDJ0305088.1 hypothetical protein [Dehalobacter sp.]